MADIIKVADLSNEDYHARPEISKSSLDSIHRSVAHFEAPFRKATAKMAFGTAFHALILEPEKFDKIYLQGTNVDRRTKEGKAAWAEQEAKAGTKTVLKFDEYEDLMRMKEQTEKHPRFGSYFESGEPETSIFWEMQGVGCKCRPDWMINGGEYIIDLKTSNDASPDNFAKSIANFRYHVQDAWYTKGVQVATRKSPTFVFLVVENVAPFSVAIYVLDGKSKDEGWMLADKDLRKYVEYKETFPADRYSGYSPDAVELSLPRWAFKEIYN
jgi:exodeoxyribonuclease VIII